MSGHGTSFFESKTWKNIKICLWPGCSGRNYGALFKIMHQQTSLMLIVG